MKALKILKTGASLVVSVGVGAIVCNLIKHTTPSDVKKITQIFIGLGSFALTGFASDIAANYTEEKIDEAVETVKSMIGDEETDVEAETEKS